MKCKKRNCKDECLVEGLCALHYLERLDKFEKKSKKAKLKCNSIYGKLGI